MHRNSKKLLGLITNLQRGGITSPVGRRAGTLFVPDINANRRRSQGGSDDSRQRQGSYQPNTWNYRTLIKGGAAICLLSLCYEWHDYARFKHKMHKRLEAKVSNEGIIHTEHDITPDQMKNLDVHEIPDDGIYSVGFSTKDGFVDIVGKAEIITLTHSSIVLYDQGAEDKKKFIVIGRQSPIYRSEMHAKEKKSEHSSEGKPKLIVGSILKSVGTSMENEKDYELFPDSPIKAVVLNEVIISGAEIKKALSETDEMVCKGQFCTMLTSNCYSASIYTLLRLMKVINEREGYPNEKKDLELVNIWKLVQSRSIDNLAFGVRNNALLESELKKTRAMMKARPGLVQHVNHAAFTDSLPSHRHIGAQGTNIKKR